MTQDGSFGASSARIPSAGLVEHLYASDAVLHVDR